MWSSKTGRKTLSVALAVWHVAPSCWNQMVPISFSSIFVNKILSLLIFKEKFSNYASEAKSAPNSDSFWVLRLFNVCMRVFCVPNATILLVYIAAKIKISLNWEDDFFLPKSASSVSRPVAIFPGVVQVHTQPYSFGGRIKLIICQIRHELSFTIQEISPSLNK